jgi:hypothetical protein
MVEEIKKDEPQKEQQKPQESIPPTDFKVAEIWIRNGQLMLDATPEFWKDKFRARGLLAYLDDIVKEAKVPNDRPKIIPAKGSFLNGLRNFKIGRKR